MRTVFYLLMSLTFASSAFADAMPSIEEIPPAAKDGAVASAPLKTDTIDSSEYRPHVGAKLPKSANTGDDGMGVKHGGVASSSITPAVGASIISAKGEKLAIATGHYARARALLIAAVREFDKGFEQVDPSALIDTGSWRNSVMDRAEDLQKILDPQPRRSQGGVRFDDSTAKTGDAGAVSKKK